MPIRDKLDTITPDDLKAVSFFVDSMSTEIRQMAKDAVAVPCHFPCHVDKEW